MNKRHFFLFILPAVLSITFTSCQKIRDYITGGGTVEVPDCQVVAVTFNQINEDETYRETLQTVEYNDAGYPVNINEYEASYDGHMRYVNDMPNPILYDEQNRLIEEGSHLGRIPYLSRYVYEGDSPLPVRDTLNMGTFRGVFVEDFEYDDAGRIIRILRRQVEPGDDGITHSDVDLRYYYDIRGNRQEHPSNPNYNGIIQYNDKLSIYSLHRVWQIRYRDFSRNSTTAADAYNEQQLPTHFAASSNTYLQPFLNVEPDAVVQYDCD